MSRHKNPIFARKLARAYAGRPGGDPSYGAYPKLPWKFFLTFEEATGLTTVREHEVTAVIGGHELATMIGAIPASAMDKDGEDLKALMRVMKLLHGGDFNDGPEARAGEDA